MTRVQGLRKKIEELETLVEQNKPCPSFHDQFNLLTPAEISASMIRHPLTYALYEIGVMIKIGDYPRYEIPLDQLREIAEHVPKLAEDCNKLWYLFQLINNLKKSLRKRAVQNPQEFFEFLRSFEIDRLYAQKASFEDKLIEYLFFNFDKDKLEDTFDQEALEGRFGKEQFWVGGFESKYYGIIPIIKILNPGKDDVVYDMGASYGRFILYGAAVTDAYYKGIEIVPERVRVGQRAIETFGFENAELVSANIKEVDFSDGTMFYLYHPFTEETLHHIIDRLREISEGRRIKIAYNCDEYGFMKKQDWLKLDNSDRRVKIYRSK